MIVKQTPSEAPYRTMNDICGTSVIMDNFIVFVCGHGE